MGHRVSAPEPLDGPAIIDAMFAVRFGEIIRAESTRTVLVRAEDEQRWRDTVAAHGLNEYLTVVGSPYVPAGQAYVVDEQALDASMQESIQRLRLGGIQ
jgi:hypothetical protein